MPSRPRQLALLLLAATMAGGSVACGGGRGRTSTSKGSVAPERVMTLEVRNDNFLDQNIFLLAGGQSQRIGFVTGNGGRTRIIVRESRIPPGSQVRFLATAVGSNGSASTGPLNVRAGDVVQFTIGVVPAQTTVFIR